VHPKASSRGARASGAAAATPLVDLFANIILVLLANSPEFLPKAVSLPRWANGAAVQAAGDQGHRILIDPDGEVLFDGVRVNELRLAELLRRTASRDEGVQIVLDSSVAFETFWDVYTGYWAAGFSKPPQLRVRSALPSASRSRAARPK